MFNTSFFHSFHSRKSTTLFARWYLHLQSRSRCRRSYSCSRSLLSRWVVAVGTALLHRVVRHILGAAAVHILGAAAVHILLAAEAAVVDSLVPSDLKRCPCALVELRKKVSTRNSRQHLMFASLPLRTRYKCLNNENNNRLKKKDVRRNPARAHFKGPDNFMPYCERCLFQFSCLYANIKN